MLAAGLLEVALSKSILRPRCRVPSPSDRSRRTTRRTIRRTCPSYTFEEGEKDHPKDEVVTLVMLEHECKPKAKM